MKTKGIIVDVGGVLIRTEDASRHRIWEKKLHLESGQLAKEVYSTEPGDRATIGQVSSEYIWQDIKKRFGLSLQDITQLQNDFYSADKLNDKFYNYIMSIRGKCKIVILSDAWDNARNIYTKKFHLDEICDKMILSAEEGMRKPDEKFIKLALSFLGTASEETLYIDDTLKYVLQAKLLNIKTIFFTDADKAIGEIETFLQ